MDRDELKTVVEEALRKADSGLDDWAVDHHSEFILDALETANECSGLAKLIEMHNQEMQGVASKVINEIYSWVINHDSDDKLSYYTLSVTDFEAFTFDLRERVGTAPSVSKQG